LPGVAGNVLVIHERIFLTLTARLRRAATLGQSKHIPAFTFFLQVIQDLLDHHRAFDAGNDTEVHGSDYMSSLKDIYDDMADNPNSGSIN